MYGLILSHNMAKTNKNNKKLSDKIIVIFLREYEYFSRRAAVVAFFLRKVFYEVSITMRQ